MSYQKTIWVKDDIVTADKLNNIEDQLESNTENITDIEGRVYIIEEHHLPINNFTDDEKEKLENLPINIEEQRDPTEIDDEYILGSTWLNTETGKAFILINVTTPLGAKWVEISPPRFDITNGHVEFNKYISEISIDSTDNHNIVITKATLPQGFSGDYADLENKPVTPTLSTDILNDALSDTKTVTPKAVVDYTYNKTETETLINSAILGLLGGES